MITKKKFKVGDYVKTRLSWSKNSSNYYTQSHVIGVVTCVEERPPFIREDKSVYNQNPLIHVTRINPKVKSVDVDYLKFDSSWLIKISKAEALVESL